ncbi:hypothetical protein ACF07U_30760 [Streptomyces californicus]|uniref:hypothetical protein n=1 Tax=Streptomyces californicus TaxID=67351 RepID=UPI0036FBFA8E
MIKKKQLIQTVGISTATLGLTLTMASPAQAYPFSAACATTGANGRVDTDRDGADTRVDFDMFYGDTLADGHHARARLITKDVNGIRKNWGWHKDTNGANNGTIRYTSYAVNQSGIFSVGIQVARFEGETMLNSCTAWGA